MSILKTICIDAPLEHNQSYLDRSLYFIREGDQIRIEALNNVNGRVFAVSRMTPQEFRKLSDKILNPGE